MSDTEKTKPMTRLLVTWVLFIPGAAWSGYVITVLWGWFVVPFGAPAISVWHAVGINILLSHMVVRRPRQSDEPNDVTFDIGLMVLVPGLFLLYGWIAALLGGFA